MKKITICVLVVVISVLLCSCRVYLSKEDVGRYYCYENNVKTETWIEFKKNCVSWKDSDGNYGSVRGSEGDYSLYANANSAVSDENLMYKGYFSNGMFSFYKIADKTEKSILCRNFYSEESSTTDKDSSFYSVAIITYSIELPKETDSNSIYTLIFGSYLSKGYGPFGISEKTYYDQDNKLCMRFAVKDCAETREFVNKIANGNPRETFLVKDENGDTVLTAKDFLKPDTYGMYDDTKPTAVFRNNQEGQRKIQEWKEENPTGILKLFIFGEYVRDVSITAGSVVNIENIEITGSNAALVAKDILLTQWDKTLSVVE